MGSIQDKIRLLCGQKGLKLPGLASELGLSTDTVRSWFYRDRGPDTQSLLRLADIAPGALAWDFLVEAGITPGRLIAWMEKHEVGTVYAGKPPATKATAKTELRSRAGTTAAAHPDREEPGGRDAEKFQPRGGRLEPALRGRNRGK